MKPNRRKFIKRSALGAVAGLTTFSMDTRGTTTEKSPRQEEALDRVLAEPVLRLEELKDPVWIETVELLRKDDNYICRVRSRDGAEGLSVSNNMQMKHLYPIFVNRIQPFFIGKDAREWEKLLEEVYVYQSNYKLQNLAFWVPLATLEFAILDLLGKLAGKSMGALLAETIYHPEIAVYQANNYRGKPAEESIDLIEKHVRETEARALKFKVGGRMSHNADYPPGRTEALIPLVRERFGPEMVIYADSNGSYTPKEAIRIGKLMEEYAYDFYEEPVPFDWYEETREVTKAITIPVAGGEQEPSMHGFRWLIKEDALDIVQPDIFYFGGMVRSMKVAKMAALKGMPCTPHISGSGLGYLYMMHFVSAVANAGPFHEFKGFNNEIPLESPTSSLSSEGGKVTVPTGPGLGVTLDPDFVAAHRVVTG
ncbi:mandelate racemase/muconate lactonizing enzyme family protein [Cyclobacterium jeungdonense]|uniref:Mandelate racemase/muconate lactonizing enzyme family protein n=1 Tax=Cyclobacterium jeungdonense TaxID=708087 RepID=A0ABT8C0K6_9BACT|nr:mandelate racemase/muconate lactonizing enzyme family protein [Cyclobacterium jeungdonense]MDN3686335.1 mandelate racemase/muconate lactonizing enzyme family protein [Cyclobacterium jeungdonense]